jgi:hypothetical protein
MGAFIDFRPKYEIVIPTGAQRSGAVVPSAHTI